MGLQCSDIISIFFVSATTLAEHRTPCLELGGPAHVLYGDNIIYETRICGNLLFSKLASVLGCIFRTGQPASDRCEQESYKARRAIFVHVTHGSEEVLEVVTSGYRDCVPGFDFVEGLLTQRRGKERRARKACFKGKISKQFSALLLF